MNPTDISKILDILVERLGPMGQATWDTMVKQVLINAQVQQTWGIWLCALAGVFLLLTIGKAGFESRWGNADWSYCWLWASLAICCIIPGVLCLTSAFLGFSNPAYYAIQLLLGR